MIVSMFTIELMVSEVGARGPATLAASQHMYVNVGHLLAPVLALVDHQPVALIQSCDLGTLCSSHQHLS